MKNVFKMVGWFLKSDKDVLANVKVLDVFQEIVTKRMLVDL